ncbi:Ig-like domain repeat protein [Streptomyces sp. NPDC018610]|uniref:Ig-like domain repeat protein n=1 Tax=Streptomyces sp. NPDC018610 TaxID=3365049 RepID=UPI00378CD659
MTRYSRVRSRRAKGLLAAFAICAVALVTGAPAAQATEPGEPSDTTVRLPTASYSRMLVDQARGRVYVSTGGLSSTVGEVLVYDFDGNLLRTVKTGSTDGASAMMLSADGAILYVATSSYLLVFDADTFAYAGGGWVSNDFFRGRCPGDIGTAGGKLWFTRMTSQYLPKDCATEPQALYSGDFLGGAHKQAGDSLVDAKFATSPGIPDKLVETYATYGTPKLVVGVYDATTGAARQLALRTYTAATDPAAPPRDIAVSPDGALVAVAAGTSGVKTLSTTGLADAAPGYGALPAGTDSTAVAFSPDGSLVARGGAADGASADLLVQQADPTRGDTPREYAFTDGTTGGDRVADRGLAFSADGSRLFAMTTNAAGDAYWLHVISRPDARYHSAFDAPPTVAPGTPFAGQAVRISGTLRLNGPAPATPARVTAVRHDADGDHTVPAATVGPDGGFTLDDTPSTTGTATYTVSFAGDAAHDPAPDTTVSVDVAKAPTELVIETPSGASTSGVLLHGTLSTAGVPLPTGTVVDVQRLTKKGATDLPAVTVGPDGGFTVNDVPPAAGSTLYTVSYAGDALHDPSADWVTVSVAGD